MKLSHRPLEIEGLYFSDVGDFMIDYLSLSLWVAQICYLACFIPQIITNFRMKSGKGISEFLLICFLNTYLFFMFYIFGLHLPMAYKIIVPLQGLATLILIGQRMYYDPAEFNQKWVWYTLNILLFVLVVPYALKEPIAVATHFGWITFVLSLVNQLPQVFKIYREKSVIGFSFLFVAFTGFAAVVETIAVFVAHLPIPSCVMALRGVVLFFIFSGLFLMYRNNNA